MYSPRSSRCTNHLRLLRNCFIRISEQWLQEAPKHANPMILIQKNRAFHCCEALCFHFYSCNKKADARTAATRYPFSNLHADSTSLFSYHKNNGRTAGFSTRCARYRPRRMPSSLSTSKYNMIADTSAAARAVTVLANWQANVCAKKRVHR